jgi:hypothetical protein
MLPFSALLTIPLDVRFAFAASTILLKADKVRDVYSSGVRKSVILRAFKNVEDVGTLSLKGRSGVKGAM